MTDDQIKMLIPVVTAVATLLVGGLASSVAIVSLVVNGRRERARLAFDEREREARWKREDKTRFHDMRLADCATFCQRTWDVLWHADPQSVFDQWTYAYQRVNLVCSAEVNARASEVVDCMKAWVDADADGKGEASSAAHRAMNGFIDAARLELGLDTELFRSEAEATAK